MLALASSSSLATGMNTDPSAARGSVMFAAPVTLKHFTTRAFRARSAICSAAELLVPTLRPANPGAIGLPRQRPCLQRKHAAFLTAGHLEVRVHLVDRFGGDQVEVVVVVIGIVVKGDQTADLAQLGKLDRLHQ